MEAFEGELKKIGRVEKPAFDEVAILSSAVNLLLQDKDAAAYVKSISSSELDFALEALRYPVEFHDLYLLWLAGLVVGGKTHLEEEYDSSLEAFGVTADEIVQLADFLRKEEPV